MSRRVARAALRLYPLGFRRRYGDEMATLLDERHQRPADVLDLVRGAVAAHVRGDHGPARLDPAGRVRVSATAVLVGWAIFALGGLAVAKLTEHGASGALRAVMAVCAVLTFAAVLAGLVPWLVAALRAAREDRVIRRALAAALACAAGPALLTAGLVAAAQLGAGRVALVMWTIGIGGCIVLLARTARRTAFLLELSPRDLTWTAAATRATAAGMAATSVAAVTLGAGGSGATLAWALLMATATAAALVSAGRAAAAVRA